MGQFVPLSAPRPQVGPTGDRVDRVLEWTRSRQLTMAEAELLLALDESTPWWAPGAR